MTTYPTTTKKRAPSGVLEAICITDILIPFIALAMLASVGSADGSLGMLFALLFIPLWLLLLIPMVAVCIHGISSTKSMPGGSKKFRLIVCSVALGLRIVATLALVLFFIVGIQQQ